MENTNTDARKSAAKILHAHLSKLVEETGNEEVLIITREYNVILDAMLEFAQSVSWDYSKSCECPNDAQIGQTWCCNTCGLPTSINTDESRPATLDEVSDEEIEEAADEFYNNASVWHGGYFKPFQAGVRWRESLSEQPECKCLFCGENFSECGHIRAEEEQPEAKPTESEQVEKLKAALETAKETIDWMLENGTWHQRYYETLGNVVPNANNLIDEALNSLKQ